MAVDVDAAMPGVPVKWRGRDWLASPGVPLAALSMAEGIEDFSLANADHAAVLVAGLFGVDASEVKALNPTREELIYILHAVAEEVGTTAGESSASSESSAE